MKDVQDLQRDNKREIFKRILQDDVLQLRPNTITISESGPCDTAVDFSFFEEASGTSRLIDVKDSRGQGFLDCVFSSCHRLYLESYSSLKNLSLNKFDVKPRIIKSTSESGTGSEVSVSFGLSVPTRGRSEFTCRSRSIIYASFTAVLQSFQFYVNCEKTFRKLENILNDARSRHRMDIEQRCIFDMSVLTEVNSYEKANSI